MIAKASMQRMGMRNLEIVNAIFFIFMFSKLVLLFPRPGAMMEESVTVCEWALQEKCIY